jgi:hypothetical protein
MGDDHISDFHNASAASGLLPADDLGVAHELSSGLSGFLKGLLVEITPLLGLSPDEKGHPKNALFRMR